MGAAGRWSRREAARKDASQLVTVVKSMEGDAHSTEGTVSDGLSAVADE